MKILHKALAASICLIQLFGLSQPVMADNSQIPGSLFSWRDSLLKDKDVLLNEKAAATTDIKMYKSGVIAIESKFYKYSPADRVSALATRAKCLQRIAELESYIASIESALIKDDRTLADVEGRMQYWACLK